MEEGSAEISAESEDVVTMMDVDVENSTSETNLVDKRNSHLDASLQGLDKNLSDNPEDNKNNSTDIFSNTTLSTDASKETVDENPPNNNKVTSQDRSEHENDIKCPVSQKEKAEVVSEIERPDEKISKPQTSQFYNTSLKEEEKNENQSFTTNKNSPVLDAVVGEENPVNRDSSNVADSSEVVVMFKDIDGAEDALALQSEQQREAQDILADVESIAQQIDGCTDLTNDDVHSSQCEKIEKISEKLKRLYSNELITLEKLNESKAKLKKTKENKEERMKREKEKLLREKCAARNRARQLIERNNQNLEYIEKQVSLFVGNAESCGYRFLEDQLTNTMQKLDSVELKEETEIYHLYEASINEAQRVLNLLENRAKSAEAIPVPTADTCVMELQKIRSELNLTSDGTMNEAQNQFLLYRVHTAKSTFADLPEDLETSNKREIVARLVQECIEKLDLKLQKPQMNIDNSETSQAYRQPMQLIIEDDNGFRLDEDALRSVVCRENVRHRKLVVLSVVGEFRRGKSFLLNFMVRYLRAKGSPNWLEYESREKLEGFNWRRDKDRVTTGILIWPEAFIIGEHAVILLDTQGTFDMDSSMKQNTFIFALSTLISSIQILNIHQRFQLDAFMNVQYFIEFGRSVLEECEEKAFQKLLILVRDWNFHESNDYGLQGGQMYWNEQHGKQTELSDSVIDCFEDIECFLMPHPGEKVANGAEFKGALCDIEEIFVKNMKIMIENVFNPSNLVPKRIGPSVLNAEDLINTTKKIVENLQHSDQKPKTLFEMTAEINHEKMISTAEDFYVSHMSKEIVKCSDIGDIVKLNEDTKNRALSLYQNKKLFGPKHLKEKYVQILKAKLDVQDTRVVHPVLKERKLLRNAELDRKLNEAIRSHKDALNACLLGPEYHMFLHIDQRERARAMSSFETITRHVRPQGFLSTIASIASAVLTKRPSYREQMSQAESDDLSAKFKKAADKTFQELQPRFKERTENHLTCVNNEAIEIYRTKMRESLNEPQSLQQFENIHNSAEKLASEHVKKRTLYLEIQAEVRSYAKKLTKWIEKTKNEFKQQNMEKFCMALEKIKLDALASYDQELGTWLREYKGPCDMQRFNENHNSTSTLALDKFANSQFDKNDKTYKSVVDSTKEAIAEKMNRAKEIFQAEGMQQSVSLTLQKYTSMMESFGAKAHFVKDLKSLHEKAEKEALDYLISLTDKSEKSEEAQKESSKAINKSYSDYIVMNCALRTQHLSTIYTNFERTIKMGLSKFQEAVLVSWQQDLQQKINSITDECLKKVLQEKDDSKEFSDLLKKAKTHIEEVKKDLLSKNEQKMQAERESIQKSIDNAINDYKSEMNSGIISLVTIPEDPQVVCFHEPAKAKALKNLKKALSHITIEVPGNSIKIAEQGIQAALEKFRTDSNNKRREKRTRQGKAGCPVGIDLGTTYSCVSIYRNGKFERIKNTWDSYTTPSVVYYTANEPTVGEEAILKGQTDNRNCISGVKRIIGRRYNDPKVQEFKKNAFFGIVDRDGIPKIEITKGAQKSCLSVEEVSADVLREMKHQASRHLKYEVKDAVVTIPAYFTEPQRAATLEACSLAGINVLRLLNEPTAAALAFGTEHKDKNLRRVLVFDFGGGTCDVSMLEIRGDSFIVKASRGDNTLGGQDIDRRLLEHVLKSQQLSRIHVKKTDESRILYECERTKRILSSKMEGEIILPNVAGIDLRITITRETFENINSDLFESALKPVRDCLSAAKLSVSQIDEVVLAGGSSNIPKMKELLVKFFKGKKLHEGINPEEAIAHGAALQAAIITKDPSLRTTITDITPHSLGIKIVGNVFSLIIPKDSSIPCEHTGRYTTVKDYQNGISIKVYQGENSVADANTLLGQFNLDDIRVAKKGEVSCDVTFKIDENGILHVTAKEVSDTKNNFKSIVIERRVI